MSLQKKEAEEDGRVKPGVTSVTIILGCLELIRKRKPRNAQLSSYSHLLSTA